MEWAKISSPVAGAGRTIKERAKKAIRLRNDVAALLNTSDNEQMLNQLRDLLVAQPTGERREELKNEVLRRIKGETASLQTLTSTPIADTGDDMSASARFVVEVINETRISIKKDRLSKLDVLLNAIDSQAIQDNDAVK
jgi:hypothetical protein